MAPELLFQNLDSPIQGDEGQFGTKRLEGGHFWPCVLAQTVPSVPCIHLPGSVSPFEMDTLIFPYLMGEGNLKGVIGGTETLNYY